ncbi:MAG: tRNA1(Val) (adenine(37)-N6)-methyltransferase [Petrotogales bacterium]
MISLFNRFKETFLSDLNLELSYPGARPNHATVLLGWYVKISKKMKRIIELGCGSAIISIYLASRYVIEVTAIDKNPYLLEIARKNIENNELKGKINVEHVDIYSVSNRFVSGYFDMVVCNPPHFSHSGLVSSKESRNEWRRLDRKLLTEFAKTTKWLLKNRGVFYYIIHPRDLTDWIKAFEDNKLGIHRIKMVHGREGKQAQLVLMKGRGNSTSEIVIEPPLILRKEENNVY